MATYFRINKMTKIRHIVENIELLLVIKSIKAVNMHWITLLYIANDRTNAKNQNRRQYSCRKVLSGPSSLLWWRLLRRSPFFASAIHQIAAQFYKYSHGHVLWRNRLTQIIKYPPPPI